MPRICFSTSTHLSVTDAVHKASMSGRTARSLFALSVNEPRMPAIAGGGRCASVSSTVAVYVSSTRSARCSASCRTIASSSADDPAVQSPAEGALGGTPGGGGVDGGAPLPPVNCELNAAVRAEIPLTSQQWNRDTSCRASFRKRSDSAGRKTSSAQHFSRHSHTTVVALMANCPPFFDATFVSVNEPNAWSSAPAISWKRRVKYTLVFHRFRNVLMTTDDRNASRLSRVRQCFSSCSRNSKDALKLVKKVEGTPAENTIGRDSSSAESTSASRALPTKSNTWIPACCCLIMSNRKLHCELNPSSRVLYKRRSSVDSGVELNSLDTT
eukprot:3778186-Pyramimonas_sp.AAC.1